MSLRDRLAGMARRTVTVPVPVSDPGEALRERARKAMETATLMEALSVQDGSRINAETAAAYRETADAAAAELAEHFEDVEFGALPPGQWEALLEEYRTDDGDIAGAALPVMLAACALDPDLQDAEWWSEQFAGPGWTFGEREHLRTAVLVLNSYIPRPGTGKG